MRNNINKVSLVKPGFTGRYNAGQMFSNIPNQFEQIRKDLWSIEFPLEMNIPEQFQVKASRPKVTNNIVEVQYKNLSTWYKGKTKTEPMTIEFRDAVGPSVFMKLQQWQRQHTDFATGKGGYAATYKKNLTLNIEDSTGAVVQKFRLYGCCLASLDGGDLDMTTDEIANIAIEIYYDSYEQEF